VGEDEDTKISPTKKHVKVVSATRKTTKVKKPKPYGSMRKQTRNNKATHLTILSYMQRNKEGYKATVHKKE